MPPEPMTTPKIALQSLLNEIVDKMHALATTSREAFTLDSDEAERVVRHCVQTDALLTVAEAIVLASLNAGSEVQS